MSSIIGIIAVIIAAFALFIAVKALNISKKQLNVSKAQLNLVTDTDIQLHTAMPNRDPIKVCLRNKGTDIKDINFIIEGRSQAQQFSYLKSEDETMFDVHRFLIEDKENIQLTVAFLNKLNERIEKQFIFNVINKRIESI